VAIDRQPHQRVLGVRLTKQLRGKLATVIEPIDHGHHVFRANFKSALLRQYEKFSRFLRNEVLSNNLNDFGLRKGLDHFDAARERFQTITDRFAGFPGAMPQRACGLPPAAEDRPAHHRRLRSLSGHQIHDTRVIRLLEVLLHGSNTVGGSTAKQIHEAVLAAFQLSPKSYSLNQLRYDLRKLKGHGLLRRDGRRYAYRLTTKGVDVALLFMIFTSASVVRSPTAASITNPIPQEGQTAKFEAAYHKADKAIENVINLLQAA
jgi:hypothetical protein